MKTYYYIKHTVYGKLYVLEGGYNCSRFNNFSDGTCNVTEYSSKESAIKDLEMLKRVFVGDEMKFKLVKVTVNEKAK